MLVGNQTIFNKSPGTWITGNATSHASGVGGGSMIRSAMVKWSDWRNFPLQDQSGATTFVNTIKTMAKPVGYYHPGVYALPTTAGEMAAGFSGTGTVTANLLPSRNMSAALTAVGLIVASASLVVSMTAALAAGATISATITGRLNMTAAVTGNASVTGAMLGRAALAATVTQTGSITANITAIASMEADITTEGTLLTVNNAANAVWDAVLANHLTPGSTGAALNAAGSAGDPWSTVLPGAYTSAQAGALFYQGYQIARNRIVTSPATGVMTVLADDNSTTLFTANLYNDAAGAIPYDGTAGINRKDRLA